MAETDQKPRRVVTARRTLKLGTAVATVAGGLSGLEASANDRDAARDWVELAQIETGGEGEGVVPGGEGEGEGEGAARLAPDIALMQNLGFMEGHLRAGLALYETGDLAAAKTHMGHPIEEKYAAVAAPLEARGFARLREEIATLAGAAEAEAPVSEIRSLFETVRATIEDVRGEVSARDQLRGLAALTRVAADEYKVAVKGGALSNLHEYQDSWGFLRVVEAEARELSGSDRAQVAEAAGRMLDHLARTDGVFGDLQGGGTYEMDPSRIYGAAARMEIAAMGVE